MDSKRDAAFRAVEFLRTLGGFSYQLASLDPALEKQAPQFAKFDDLSNGAAEAWIEARIYKYNLYYTFNETYVEGKPRKSEIAFKRGIQVDIDPRPNYDLSAERNRIHKLLTTELPSVIPPPTLIVDSGNGYQAVWLYDQLVEGPALMDRSAHQAAILQLEAPGKELALLLGGEGYTLEHLMRLPWTTNYPNTKKRKLGRTLSPTSVIGSVGVKYSPGDFDHLILPKQRSSVRDDPQPLMHPSMGVEEEQRLFSPDGQITDRSKLAFRIIKYLAERGFSEEAIVSAFQRNSDSPANQHYSSEDALRADVKRVAKKASTLPNASKSFSSAVTATKDVRDSLVGLVERTAADPGAPFVPNVLARLAELKKSDHATFETLRSQLKKCGARVTALDDAVSREVGEKGGRRPTQADVLLELAQSAELFHTSDQIGYADVHNNGHRETWSIRSSGFRRWLGHRFFELTQSAPSSEALKSALGTIEARAQFNAPERCVHIRVGDFNGKYYLDLCDETWSVVEMDASGWRVVKDSPIRFRRERGMQPIPIPVHGGSITALRSFLNVQSEHDFVLIIAWLLAALRSGLPYPVLVLSGEQGSAKSTFSKIVRALVDPNTAPLRALPREDRDFFIAANNSHLLVFDNVSSLPPWISDTLCRLATGGGYAVRQLYSDQEETLFDSIRPMIINGIEDIVTRSDLADRALLLKLEPIPEERRQSEKEFWSDFETHRSTILGALLNAVAEGIRRLPEIHLERLPRMADFAKWATACETAFFEPGTFWSAYCGNRDEAVDRVLDADPIATAIRTLMATRSEWIGTATDLLAILVRGGGTGVEHPRSWPANPRALSNRLTRAGSFLRAAGIDIRFSRSGGRNRDRNIRISKAPILPRTE